jgi:hypothetical protein
MASSQDLLAELENSEHIMEGILSDIDNLLNEFELESGGPKATSSNWIQGLLSKYLQCYKARNRHYWIIIPVFFHFRKCSKSTRKALKTDKLMKKWLAIKNCYIIEINCVLRILSYFVSRKHIGPIFLGTGTSFHNKQIVCTSCTFEKFVKFIKIHEVLCTVGENIKLNTNYILPYVLHVVSKQIYIINKKDFLSK